MGISLSCCTLCECYTVFCDRCSQAANQCGNYDKGQAAERARIAGYKTFYDSIGSAAIWLCKSCQAVKAGHVVC